jgi:hypothetical protein
MYRKAVIGAVGAMVLMSSTAAFAQGTAADAQAMLAKAVAAVKADKTKALDMMNKEDSEFVKGDIYAFCFNAGDGVIMANPNPNAKRLLGTDVRALMDPTGNAYGLKFYAAAQKPEGQITAVSYEFQKAGGNNTNPVPKVSFVTRVGDLGCGVGYYKY